MIKKIIKSYCKLLDEKLENGTLVVVLIAGLIISASLLTNNSNTALYTKNNILEVQNIYTSSNNIVEINGIKYNLILENIVK